MINYILENFSTHIHALIAGLFLLLTTSLGAFTVFFFKNITNIITTILLGFSAGIMLAASIFSLLIPSIEFSKNLNIPFFIPPVVGFLLGGLFLKILDKTIPHFHVNTNLKEGISSNFNKTTLLILAITLHNIPEGLAVGISFGSNISKDIQLFTASVALALGIGLQNIPEGASVSYPLRSLGMSRKKSFILGTVSGVVEPFFAILGSLLVSFFKGILPYALSFSAGAMIYVVVEEIIPESKSNKNIDLATLSTMVGFTTMMLLDIIFN